MESNQRTGLVAGCGLSFIAWPASGFLFASQSAVRKQLPDSSAALASTHCTPQTANEEKSKQLVTVSKLVYSCLPRVNYVTEIIKTTWALKK